MEKNILMLACGRKDPGITLRGSLGTVDKLPGGRVFPRYLMRTPKGRSGALFCGPCTLMRGLCVNSSACTHGPATLACSQMARAERVWPESPMCLQTQNSSLKIDRKVLSSETSWSTWQTLSQQTNPACSRRVGTESRKAGSSSCGR